jgi:hypothetical protein
MYFIAILLRWRVSGELRGEAEERVRCTRGLGARSCKYIEVPAKVAYVEARLVVDHAEPFLASKNPSLGLTNEARQIDLSLTLARNTAPNDPHKVLDRENENVTTIANIPREHVRYEKVFVVEIVLEFRLLEESPRCEIKQRFLPRRTDLVQLPVLDLDLSVNSPACNIASKDYVDLVDVKKPAVRIPALFEKLELRIGLAQDLVVSGSPAQAGVERTGGLRHGFSFGRLTSC